MVGAVLGSGGTDVRSSETCCYGTFGRSLIPLFLIIGSGGVGAGLYLMRLAVFNPDVCWDKKNNPEPWNKMSPSDQYKFYSVNVDYSRLKKDRPDF
nr:PREDICTED: cytochrome c oxidase subunit NDUFA4-like [Phalacrocorax carbo]